MELGDVGALALDENANTIYIVDTGFRSGKINVISPFYYDTSMKIYRNISFENPVNIAVDPITNMLYLTNMFDEAVFILDSLTEKILYREKIPGTPSDIVFNSNTAKAYVMNRYTDNISVINSTGKKRGDIPIGSYFF